MSNKSKNDPPERIILPPVLPGDLDLGTLNSRLRSGAAMLDWRNVVDAPDSALIQLLTGVDIVDDALGLETIPEPLFAAILAALETNINALPGARRPPRGKKTATRTATTAVTATAATLPSAPVDTADKPDVLDAPAYATDEEPAGDAAAPAIDASSADSAMPVLRSQSQTELRRALQEMVQRDLLGPAAGEEEEIADENVRDRYIVGALAPRSVPVDTNEQDTLEVSADDAPEDGAAESENAVSGSLNPSSFGLTCCVAGHVTSLRVTARWGAYQRVKSETLTNPKTGAPKSVWKRRPMGGVIERLELREGALEPQALTAEQPVYIRGEARRLGDEWIVTLFLVNDQPDRRKLKDAAWLFQAELALDAPSGEPIFCRHVIADRYQRLDPLDQHEQRAFAMRYRNRVEFAIGHGVSVHADPLADDPTRARRIETRAVPMYELADTISPDPATIPGLAALPLDMKMLAGMEMPQLVAALAALPNAYAQWIEEQAQRAADPQSGLAEHHQAMEEALAVCRVARERIQAGVALLERDPDAAEAFRFMNRAMWLQRIHTLAAEAARRGDKQAVEAFDVTLNRSWRLFQLGFILLNLPALTDLRHPDRSASPEAAADLLWFPTGGGKTEAYLGLTAYTLAMRRLQGTVEGRSGEAGVAVLMRYTLRLLTLQQFQRAAALICACERIRLDTAARGDQRWGQEPFRLGLWVGQRTTPNYTDQSADAIQSSRGRYRPSVFGGSGTPAQLTSCPWCGGAIDPGRHIKVSSFNQGSGRTLIYCGDPLGSCPFSERQAPGEGLPVLVVDEEIYRRLPALVIATVDKFAQLPWKGPVGMLFGQVNGYCPRHGYRSPDLEDTDSHPARNGLPAVKTQPCAPLRPPDLIIQDELHLISGPLGTLVGLYETAVDRLASWQVGGQTIRPKVIASTATVRRAPEQMRALFLRSVQVFPPQGLDAENNFFSQQVPPSAEHPGRLYVGFCAFGHRMKQALIRVYAAYLLAAQTLYVDYGTLIDPWMTLVGYFNSIRELAGMRRLVDENVRTALKNGKKHGFAERQRPELKELTSRIGAQGIPEILDLLGLGFPPPGQAAQRRNAQSARAPRPLDVLLATNMVSVGVDVQRLGLMVVASQPKTTAEYIQATSRVGRAFPGLVCTVFNWARPRDLSHYETFEHYHATFYAHVEALSVTPFAPRALDRGLSALLVALVRQRGMEFNANTRASAITANHPYVHEAINDLTQRAIQVTSHTRTAERMTRELQTRLDDWVSQAADHSGGYILGYQERKDGRTRALLHAPDLLPWRLFTCLNSLRDVEPAVMLMLDDRPMDDGAQHPLTLAGTAPANANQQDDDTVDDNEDNKDNEDTDDEDDVNDSAGDTADEEDAGDGF
jgi:hypothetical protein